MLPRNLLSLGHGHLKAHGSRHAYEVNTIHLSKMPSDREIAALANARTDIDSTTSVVSPDRRIMHNYSKMLDII